MSNIHPKHVYFSECLVSLIELMENSFDDVDLGYHLAFRTLAVMACGVYQDAETMKTLVGQAITEGMSDYRKKEESEEAQTETETEADSEETNDS